MTHVGLLHSSSLYCHHLLNVAIALSPDADLILRFLMWQMDVFKLQSYGGGKASLPAPLTSMSQCLLQP